MTSVRIPLMWRGDGAVLVPSAIVPQLLREIEEQLACWPEQGADANTVAAVRTLLRKVADQIDLDCIAIASALADES
ncbi:hypothetical protein [Streptacidiphilus rugosus]|uniref:hypothetical protein n=1 Tax=Streptacidiphilus rugosus TaxID=405783 RepID=UPI0005607733|nr:hypothetical protein [Streptacidiphilus rugosus]